MPAPQSNVVSLPASVRCVRLLAAVLGGAWALVGQAADGDFRWAYKLDSSSRAPTTESSPAVDEQGTVYIGYSWGDATHPFGNVVAIAPTPDGKATQKWTFAATNNVEAAPTLAPDGTLYVGDMAGMVFAIDRTTGAEKWRYDTSAIVPGLPYVAGAIALSPDAQTIYVGVGTLPTDLNGADNGGALVALSSSGRLLWNSRFSRRVESSPIVARSGQIYLGGFDGILHAFNPDGSENWRRTLDGPIQGGAALAGDGTIYVGTRANQFVAITADNQVRWTRPMIVPGTPVVGPDGVIYVGDYGTFTFNALNWRDGSTKWSVSGKLLTTSSAGAVVRSDGVVLYGGLDSTLRAYRSKDGSVVWSSGSSTYTSLDSSPVISPDSAHTIYIASYSGTYNAATLYAFSGNQYGVSRYASWPMFQHDPSHTGTGPETVQGGRLLNLTTRGQVTPTHPLIGGFVPAGKGVKHLLLRAVGPALAPYGVSTPLGDPRLVLRITGGAVAPTINDNWGDNPDPANLAQVSAGAGAFPLPEGSKDSAMLLDALNLSPYNYTATVESADGSSGVALFETYDLDASNQDSQLVNLSTRGRVGTGANVLIAGLVVGGPGRQRVLVRAVGPGLAPYNVTDYLAQPQITVYNGNSQIIDGNTGWKTGPWPDDMPFVASAIGAFPLADNDSALILTLDPGSYTFIVSGVGGSVGEALVEVYALPF